MQKLNLSNFTPMTAAQLDSKDYLVVDMMNPNVTQHLEMSLARANSKNLMFQFKSRNAVLVFRSSQVALKALKKISLTDKE